MLNWLYLSGNILYDIFKLFAGTKKLKFGLEEKGQRMRDLWTKVRFEPLKLRRARGQLYRLIFDLNLFIICACIVFLVCFFRTVLYCISFV